MQEILKEIIRHKREEVQERQKRFPLSVLRAGLRDLSKTRDFHGAVSGGPRATKDVQGIGCIRLIAEIKKASPSRGVLSKDFDPLFLAKVYEASGASALSILTDEHFFLGHLHFLSLVKIHSTLPLLQKDFILDVYQIYEARRWGADAILLIASVLQDEELGGFYRIARELDMAVVIEVHNEMELERVLPIRPRIVGINNRDLQTFETSLETTRRLARAIPSDVVVISESGLLNREDILRVEEVGVDAILVGEALMTSLDIPAKVKELLGR